VQAESCREAGKPGAHDDDVLNLNRVLSLHAFDEHSTRMDGQKDEAGGIE